jgi:hypothetical protein
MAEDAKRCPQLYKYRYIDGWRPKGENIHLRFGSEVHQSFWEYDFSRASGIPHEDALHDVVHNLVNRTWGWDPDPEDHPAAKSKNRWSLIRTVIDYLDQYNPGDPAETFILDNGNPAVELSFNFELDLAPKVGDRPYTLCGHLDKVVTFNGDQYIMDYKTTTRTAGGYFFDQYSPNNQMSLYTVASQVVLGLPVKGVIINAIQILADSTRCVRGFTYRTEDQLREWLYDLDHFLLLMETYATNEYWPKNDTACDKYGGCPFREACSKSPSVREIYLKSKFEKAEPWNPLATR